MVVCDWPSCGDPPGDSELWRFRISVGRPRLIVPVIFGVVLVGGSGESSDLLSESLMVKVRGIL